MRDSLRRELGAHPLFDRLADPAALRRFMESHVACVWDYMAQLLRLRHDLDGTTLWTPPGDPEAVRFVDELVLSSQSDEIGPGRYGSHFEWYLLAMDEVGAQAAPVRRYVSGLRRGLEPGAALQASGLAADTQVFLRASVQALAAPLHARAARFLETHESLIPEGLPGALDRLVDKGLRCASLVAFLARRRALRREALRLLAERWIARLQADDAQRRLEGEALVTGAMRARRRLWDATLGAIGSASAMA